MRAGALKHIADIQKRSVVRNTTGEATEMWDTYMKVNASVESLRGREFFAAQQVNSETTTKVQIRQCRGKRFDTKMRILVDGERAFDIKAVIEDWDRGRAVVFMCSEINEYQH